MQALINGTVYDAESNFSISEQMGNKTSSTISVLVEDQPFPTAGDVIELQDNNGNPIFLGTCGIPKSPKYQTGLEKKIYQITCNNANSILANRIINVAFQNETITEIVQNLFTQYISEEGITLGGISDISVTMEVYTAADFNLQDALNELADLVNAVWRVDNNKVFWFLVEADFPQFPQTINEQFLLGTDLQHTTKNYKTRTVQYITGAQDVTSPQTETYTYDGEQNSFTTVFPISQKPTISINGTVVDPSLIGINGIDDSDPNIVFAYTYNSQTIAIKSTDYMAAGSIVTIQYVGIFPIRVVAYNQDKIAEIAQLTGTSGKREQVYLNTDIVTMTDAIQLAQSLLTQFSESTGEITFWLLKSQLNALGYTLDDLDIFTQITFDLSSLGISGNYVITERNIEMFSVASQNYKVSFKLCNRNYLKSYGETISALYRDISQLYIRQDEIVINQPSFAETEALTESIQTSIGIPHMCVSSVMFAQLFNPLSFTENWFPTAGGLFSGDLDEPTVYYPYDSMLQNSYFAPISLGGNVYPV